MATDAKKAKEEAPANVNTVTLTIDGQEVTVPKGTTVLVAARGMGVHIPTFCWHPKLKSVGACRICYVEIEKMRTLMVSCATACMDGMVVHTASDAVLRGRRAIIEFTLANHPLDCPTCDKGGECDLQDLSFAHGLDDSRFDFQKSRFREEDSTPVYDDLRIGPEIVINRNRCIRCYRCVRSNKEAFGEWDLGAFERGNITQIGPAPGQQVDNPFSGNLHENCPVGALLPTDFRYKIRTWLTQSVPVIDPYYSSGVNLTLSKDDARNQIYRAMSRCNDDIDDGWISDVSRYGYQVAMSEERLKTPLIKKEGTQVPATWDEALEVIHKKVDEIISHKGRVCLGGLIAPHMDNTTMHSFNKFIRKSIGSNNIDYRNDYRMLPSDSNNNYYVLCSQPFSIADIDNSDVIVTFGTDMVREHPNEYLRVRKAVNFNGARVFSMSQFEVKSADVAESELVFNAGTAEVALNALCLTAIEEGIVDGAMAGDLKEKISPSTLDEAVKLSGVDRAGLKILARALTDGKKITFLAGQLVSRSKEREAIASAMCNVNRLFRLSDKGQMAILPRYANSRGAWELGLLPEPHPAVKKELESTWGAFSEATPCTTDKMIVNMKKEEVDGFFVMGANPAMLHPDQEFAREGLERLDFLVVCDLFETETTALADVVLPLASWAEYTADYVNLEGRLQKSQQAIQARFDSKPGYEILDLMAERMGEKLFESDEARQSEIEKILTVDTTIAWPDGFTDSKHVPAEQDEEFPVPLFVCDDLHHSGHLTEKSGSLVNFCGEPYIEMSPDLVSRYDLAEGDAVRVESPVGKIVVPVMISEHIDSDVVLIPRNFSSVQVTSLLMRKKRVDYVKLSKVAD